MTHPWEVPPTGPRARLSEAMAIPLPRITTDRLILRAPRLTDFPVYADIYLSPRWPHGDETPTHEAAWYDFCEMTVGWYWRGSGVLTITDPAGTVLGFTLLSHEYGDPELELGWMLTDAAEGHGYATEAAKALRRWAAETLGLRRPVSYIDADNPRSAATATRLGAKRDAAAEAAVNHAGHAYRHPSERDA